MHSKTDEAAEMANQTAEEETTQLGFEVSLENLAKPTVPAKMPEPPENSLLKAIRDCSQVLFKRIFHFHNRRWFLEKAEESQTLASPLFPMEFQEKTEVGLKLDVGCGTNPQGDVNCDLFMDDVGHRGGAQNGDDKTIHKATVKNFVLCDVLHLPFRTEAFGEVISSHVIEHLDEPFRLVCEMMRVAKQKVTIICPNGLGDRLNRLHRSGFHKQFLNKKWFSKVAREFGSTIDVKYSSFWSFPHDNAPLLQIPSEISAVIRKVSLETVNTSRHDFVSAVEVPLLEQVS